MGAVSPLAPEPWKRDAACATSGLDPETWFPGTGAEGNRQARAAKAVCATCPVREACLEYAVRTGERFGIWGGLTERERRKGRRDRVSICHFCRRAFVASSARLYCSKECRGEASRAVRRDHMRKVRLKT